MISIKLWWQKTAVTANHRLKGFTFMEGSIKRTLLALDDPPGQSRIHV